MENPEDGLDEDTEEMGIVVDYDTKEDAEQGELFLFFSLFVPAFNFVF